jgi:hypothetical protein
MAAKRVGRRGKSKAQSIRDVLEEKGRDSAPKDVIADLAQKRIKVSAAQVSNIKADLARKAGDYTRSRGRRKLKANGEISVASLLAVKQMADKMGGVAHVRRALETLARLS